MNNQLGDIGETELSYLEDLLERIQNISDTLNPEFNTLAGTFHNRFDTFIGNCEDGIYGNYSSELRRQGFKLLYDFLDFYSKYYSNLIEDTLLKSNINKANNIVAFLVHEGYTSIFKRDEIITLMRKLDSLNLQNSVSWLDNNKNDLM